MFFDLNVGRLVDAQSGATLEPSAVNAAVTARATQFRALGLQPRDRVLLHYGNRPEFFIDLLAIWRSGACAAPLDARATPTEIARIAATLKPKLSLWHDAPPAAALTALGSVQVMTCADAPHAQVVTSAPAAFQLDDDALILFTSGTTGDPKGVVHTHRSLRARWTALRAELGTAAHARTLCLLPTHFGHGLICNSLYPWLSGCDLFILPPFRADLLLGLGELIDCHGITFMSSVPTVWRLVLKMAKPPQKQSLQRVFCGSAPLSAHLWSGIRDWTRAAEVCNAYGITETGSWVAGTLGVANSPTDGLVGRGWGTLVRILRRGDTDSPPEASDECGPGEEGFVWLQTPGLMRGYLAREDLTAAVLSGGWFSTGDVGVLDEHGLLHLRGRQREEINKGGMKIHPADIDGVIERFAGVADVCSFAFEHALYGEEVGVAVVPHADVALDLAALRRWTEQELGAHRTPVRWHLLDEIPRTSRGKINRTQVAAACASRGEPAA